MPPPSPQEAAESQRREAAAEAAQLQTLVASEQARAEAALASTAGLKAQAQASCQAAEEASAAAAAARQQAAEAESELAALRAAAAAGGLGGGAASGAGALFTTPSRENVMSGLELEGWAYKPEIEADDIESTPSKAFPKPGRANRAKAKLSEIKGAVKRISNRHQISSRLWFLAAYMLVLHLALMISFTRHDPDLSACAHAFTLHGNNGAGGQDGRLP